MIGRTVKYEIHILQTKTILQFSSVTGSREKGLLGFKKRDLDSYVPTLCSRFPRIYVEVTLRVTRKLWTGTLN